MTLEAGSLFSETETESTPTALKTASVLAFERKLEPSDALLSSGYWENREASTNWKPITLQEKSIRGTISNRRKAKESDAAKLDGDIQNPNLQTVDVAALPPDSDTLKVHFSLRILPGVGIPSACNNVEYQRQLETVVGGYSTSIGFAELAGRYAFNLANGRFLWRNRMGAERVEIGVSHMVNGERAATWTFDALSLPLRNFPLNVNSSINELGTLISRGLGGEANVLLDINAFVRLGVGQEVFPSQELILDRSQGRSQGRKSKTLYAVGGVAGIHSQKIGNAIRTVDTWYSQANDLPPIAVEPYGSVTSQGKAFRPPKGKNDFFTLLDNWILDGRAPSLDNQHYVIAVLVRGGVFGEAEKD